MQTRLRISEKANKQLNHLSNRLELRRNIVCRIAVGKSLTINDSVKDYEFDDNKGPEFNRVTLTGDQDLIFKEVDENDKRIMKIFLTEYGVKKRKLVREILINFNQKLNKIISKKELKIFYKVINAINDLAYQENPAKINNNKQN